MATIARKSPASPAAKARSSGRRRPETSKSKRENALRKIANILENYMTEMGLSEAEKNAKTAQLVEMVSEAVTAKLSLPTKHSMLRRTAVNRV